MSTLAESKRNNGIAIIGMSGRFPGANSVEEFWENLLSGKDCTSTVPQNRAYFHGDRNTQGGYLNSNLDEFDEDFFNVNPKDSAHMDPQQKLFLEASWESLENAGIPPSMLKGSSTGVFVGMCGKEYETFLRRSTQTEPTNFLGELQGNTWSGTSGRLSRFLDLRGPSVAVEATCASATLAIHSACQSLSSGETQLCIAGGVNLILEQPQRFPPNILSSRCKTFDRDADGFLPAEGVGVFVLKRVSDARRDGNKILGIITASAVGHDGSTRSFGTPNSDAQAQVMKRAFEQAGITPNDVNYVEAHGTGTRVGDLKELEGIRKVFQNRSSPLVIGATKPNIGHSLAASGALSLIKVLCCLNTKTVPPVRLVNLRHEIDTILKEIDAFLPSDPTPLGETGRPIIASLSSFGITGTVGILVIEEAPEHLKPDNLKPLAERCWSTPHLVNVSAQSTLGLEQLLEAYKMFASKMEDSDFPRLAHSMSCERDHLPHRITVVATTKDEFLKKLENRDFLTGIVSKNDNPSPITFLFTGNGVQYFGMGRNLYETSQVFRHVLDSCDILFQSTFQQSLKTILWGDELEFENAAAIYSPATFCLQYALFCLWTTGFGIVPTVVLGHSFGEYAASVAAGIYTFKEVFELVCKRTELINSLRDGGMMAVTASEEMVVELVAELEENFPGSTLGVGAINSDREIVLSGSTDSLGLFSNICQPKGIRTRILRIDNAYHSRAMDPILADFQAAARDLNPGKLNSKYISSATALELNDDDFTPEYWTNHLRNPVQFAKAVQLVLKSGCKTFVEIGPQPILCNLVLANADSIGDVELVLCPTLRRSAPNDWKTILGSLGKLYVSWSGELDWGNIFGNGRLGNGIFNNLPNYPFQRTKTLSLPPKNSSSATIGARLERGSKLHPLLSAKCNLPSVSTTWFTNPTVFESYLADHIVNGEIILPGACYLETIFAIGVHHLKEEVSRLVVEDLEFESPLSLNPEPLKYQTSANLVTPDNCIVQMFSQVDGGDWMRNSSGKLRLTQAETVTSCPHEKVLDYSEVCGIPIEMDQVYKTFQSYGITLGTKFQTLSEGTLLDNGDMIFRVRLHEVESDEYVIHPIILDAMIQGCLYAEVGRKSSTDSLIVPKRVGRVQIFGKVAYAHNLTVHVAHAQKSVKLCQDGNVLLLMSGVTFATSARKGLKDPSRPIRQVPFYEEKWIAVSEKRIKMSPPVTSISVVISNKTKTDAELYKQLDDLACLYVLKTLYALNWRPKVGATVSVKTFSSILAKGRAYFEYTIHEFLSILECAGILERVRGLEGKSLSDDFKILRLPLSEPAVLRQISTMAAGNASNKIEQNFLTHCGENLTDVFLGNKDPISLLFSNPDTNASIFYASAQKLLSDTLELMHAFEQCLDHLQTTDTYTLRTPLRILEIGAGTGATTRRILELLDKRKATLSYVYTFTDVGPAFLARAKESFKSEESNITFETLDIEKDPFSQGFVPAQFDFIIAANVFHATRDLKVTLSHVNNLLVTDGCLLLNELTQKCRLYDLTFGLLEGWWRFTDFRKDQLHPLVGPMVWQELLVQSGFQPVGSAETHSGVFLASKTVTANINHEITTLEKFWIVYNHFSGKIATSITSELGKLGRAGLIFCSAQTERSDFKTFLSNLQGRDVEGAIFLGGLEAGNVTHWSELRNMTTRFIELLREGAHLNLGDRLVLVTRGVGTVPGKGFINCASSTIYGILKSFRNEHTNIRSVCLDLDPTPSGIECEASNIVSQLWNRECPQILSFRKSEIWTPRLIVSPAKSIQPNLVKELPEILNDFQLKSDVGIELSSSAVVSIKAVGLNFRDVLLASNLLPGAEQRFGLEYSGIFSSTKSNRFKVGDRVMGLCAGGAFAEKLQTDDSLLMKIPDHMGLKEAATIPIAFGTAYHCLVHVSRIQPSQVLLVHTASGGLGLAAIQVAKWLGAEVYATAGSERKRNFLKEFYGLSHVYDSRSSGSFFDGIHEDTNGTGVDVVLNTLTGPGFAEASLKLLKPTGTILELSKLNIRSKEEIGEIHPNVKYEVVDIFGMIQNSDPELKKTLLQLEVLFGSKTFDSLPYRHYASSSISTAFQYFQTAQHIGKIVIALGKDPIFNKESTYVVTGGLGGIGLKVCEWILRNGGRDVILFGRSLPTPPQRDVLRGTGVRIVHGDVSNFEDCSRLFKYVKYNYFSSSPVRGIFHCAGLLADAALTSQSWNQFEYVYKPKVCGSWNLHLLTRGVPLDHFVLFSSIASIIGTPGQSNHSAANTFLDSLAHLRVNHLGLRAQSINWGTWADVGAAANLTRGIYREVHHFSPDEGIVGLEEAIGMNQAQLVVARVDEIGASILPRLASYMSELCEGYGRAITEGKETSLATLERRSRELVDEIRNGKPEDKIQTQVETFIGESIRFYSGLRSDTSSYDPNSSLSSLGVDSLMAMELRTKLSKSFELPIPLQAFQEHDNIRSLGKYILGLFCNSR